MYLHGIIRKRINVSFDIHVYYGIIWFIHQTLKTVGCYSPDTFTDGQTDIRIYTLKPRKMTQSNNDAICLPSPWQPGPLQTRASQPFLA